MWRVVYHPQVVADDIPNLSSVSRHRIKRAISERLSTNPDLYGKPLRRSLRGYRKLRVGDYRIIFRLEVKTVKVIMIEHRSRVYQ